MTKEEVDRITDRPWQGKCATSGLTVEEFGERLENVSDLPAWVTRAAVSICRSYGLGRGLADPAYIANVIHGELMRASEVGRPAPQCRFTVTIDTANAAFEDPGELPRILQGIIDRVWNGDTDGSVRDVNGNRVGAFRFGER